MGAPAWGFAKDSDIIHYLVWNLGCMIKEDPSIISTDVVGLENCFPRLWTIRHFADNSKFKGRWSLGAVKNREKAVKSSPNGRYLP